MTVNRILLLDLEHHLKRFSFFKKNHSGPKVGINSTYESIEEFKVVKKYNPSWSDEKIWIPAGRLYRVPNLPEFPSNGCQIVYGPNIHFEDICNKRYLNNREITFLVPSEWVIEVAKKYLPQVNVVVFPYGIHIPDVAQLAKQEEIILYVKNEKNYIKLKDEIEIVKNFAESRGLVIKLFEYGQYEKDDFLNSLKTARFAVWLGQTESQGIALMEAWSYNVPTLVRRKDLWLDHDGEIFKSEAAPYLNSDRGAYTNSESLCASDLESFVAQLMGFNPRQSLIGDLDYATIAQRFRKLFTS